MKLQIAENRLASFDARDTAEVSKPKITDGLRNRHTAGVFLPQQSIVDAANQRSAANKWDAKSHSFLFGKADDLQRKGQALAAKTPDQRDTQDHPQNAVEGTRVGHRIEM